jgi:hypothetical protein
MAYVPLIIEPADQRSSRSSDAGRDACRRMLDYSEQLQ